ncbi:polysaccharide deacetylase family protein [Aquabacterium sp.]|uniref:polysaccharide deacetylase family protein n=1 Tax=Aquabacterium sp. TaxID=1872578 RepID=UPI002C1EBC58|nr:hypothetical protein [Aquabacterium sp.]HSW08974.1 hypothetical protein [Aquabacterium sp.]
MNVYLSFDVEVWCNGWSQLDERFPAAFERYVYGRSSRGEYALPKTLEILQRNGLRGVFFVEPLFAARFGQSYLARIVRMIEAAGQDVQLHLHPEWTDEIRPPILDDVSVKRQHLSFYTPDEQTALIRFGKQLLETETGRPVSAFRAGSFAANAGTYGALRRNGITVDSSINEAWSGSAADIDAGQRCALPGLIDGVVSYPLTVFRDGFGRLRPAQVGACSFAEMRAALSGAADRGREHFVIVSHNFEMLRPGSSEPDNIVVRRFETLCAWLSAQRDRFRVGSFPLSTGTAGADRPVRPSAGPWATGWRFAEQALRRL